MKKYILLIFISSFLFGCAFIKEQVDYVKLCSNDPSCLASAKSDSELVKNIVASAYPIAGGAAGASTMIIALWIRGKKKEKEGT
jgi:hypothetical protein